MRRIYELVQVNCVVLPTTVTPVTRLFFFVWVPVTAYTACVG